MEQIMKAYREIDTYKDFDLPDSILYLKGDMLYATKSPDSGIRVLTTPLRIDRRGRKFVELKNVEMPDLNSQVEVIEVEGSTGKTYYITMTETPSCSCPGYQFRGKCKHVKELDAQ
jgi:hypothetical protein